jgi:hypothetical protein
LAIHRSSQPRTGSMTRRPGRRVASGLLCLVMGRLVNVGRTSPHSASARGSRQLGHQLACAELSGLAEPGVARRTSPLLGSRNAREAALGYAQGLA